jgi:FkbM family methyltransferase
MLRHNRSDAWVMHEVVRDSFYAPPGEVKALLPAAPHVLDLGGNIGFFGVLLFATLPGVRITAFEPDPGNLELLRRCIEANGRTDSWSVVAACASASDGELGFLSGLGALSRVPEAGQPPDITVPAVDVFPYLQGIDLLKIDIEGGEWEILADERFASAAPPAILLEWHSYGCATDNPRTAAARALEALGYTVRHEKPSPVGDDDPLYGAGTLWAWRPSG